MGVLCGKESSTLDKPGQSILTVWGDFFSSETRTIMTMIRMADLKHEFHEIDQFKGDHKTEDYLKLNPIGTLPTVTEGRFLILGGYIVFLNYLVNHHREIRDKLYSDE